MIALRGYIAGLRTAFFVGVWSLIAAIFIFLGVMRGNFGYVAIALAVGIFGSLVTRAPDETQIEGAFGYFGRRLIAAAITLALVGVVMVWAW